MIHVDIDDSEGPFAEVPLIAAWDASLTYDLLGDSDSAGDLSVFVGRAALIGPLVNAVGQPDRRGTYLVAGYRGAGKTSLVIAAIHRARAQLDQERWRLLPIVLNVSEVSASLDTASDGAAAGLRIDARKLLTAMLRALRNEELSGGPDVDALREKIRHSYVKAGSTRYSETHKGGSEVLETRKQESSRSLTAPNLLKLVAAVAALAAGVVEVGALTDAIGSAHLAAGGLAAVAIGSYARARTWTRTASSSATTSTERVLDNSLHQLESELKEILQDLHDKRWRTVVVLEELDKIEDNRGRQLESVIRYFKNLFTQAPALFFFLTDKAYYELVSQRIEAARSQRSYAVEHTFFTHRLFVARPGLDDCLDYLTSILADRSGPAAAALAEIRRSSSDRVRSLDSMEPLEQCFRAVLFQSQDHFFDLKSELRKFYRVVDSMPVLQFDRFSMPASNRAVAVFHFLVEQKMRSFFFGGGREYANEALRNALFAVFEVVDPTVARPLDEVYPDLGTSGDRLSGSERLEVCKAVDSLLDELVRGGVLELEAVQPATATVSTTPRRCLRWRHPEPALVFHPQARLEEHERALVDDLHRMADIADQLIASGITADLAPAIDPVLAAGLRERAEEVSRSPAPVPLDRARAVHAEAERRFTPAVADLVHRHVARLSGEHDLAFEQVGQFTFVLRTRTESHRVLLVYDYAVDDAAESWDRLLSGAGAVAVVAVTLGPSASSSLAQAVSRTSRTSTVALYTIPIVEEPRDTSREPLWGQRTADELRFADLWAERAAATGQRPPPAAAQAASHVLLSRDGGVSRHADLQAACAQWLRGEDEVLVWDPDVGPPPDELVAVLASDPGVLVLPQDELARLASLGMAPDVVERLGRRGRLLADCTEAPPWVAGEVAATGFRVLLPIRPQFQAQPDGLGGFSVPLPLPVDPSSVPAVLHPASGRDVPLRIAALLETLPRPGPDHAVTLLEERAQAGGREEQAELIAILTQQGRREESRRWSDELLREGAADPGLLATTGRRVAGDDPETALRLLTAAAEAGDSTAAGALTLMLVESEPKESRRWRAIVQSSGQPELMRRVAARLAVSDREGGLELYKGSAEAGDVWAMSALTVLLSRSDPEASRHWREALLARRTLRTPSWTPPGACRRRTAPERCNSTGRWRPADAPG